jgi:hypothetical protein
VAAAGASTSAEGRSQEAVSHWLGLGTGARPAPMPRPALPARRRRRRTPHALPTSRSRAHSATKPGQRTGEPGRSDPSSAEDIREVREERSAAL